MTRDNLIDEEVEVEFYKDTGITTRVVYAKHRGYLDDWGEQHFYKKVITCTEQGFITVYEKERGMTFWKTRIK